MNITKIDIAKTKRFGGSNKPYLAIPRVYSEDNSIGIGDAIEFFRTVYDGQDALLIIPQKPNGASKKTSVMTEENLEK